MLLSIRDKLVGWVAWAIVLVIGVPFAILGITDFGSTASSMAVAEVDDLQIEQQEYQRRTQIRRRNLQQQLGSNYRPDKFDSVIQQQVLNQMIEERLLQQLAEDNYLHVGDEELAASIKSDPSFFQDGKFDFEYYKTRIAQLGFTPASYEESLKQDRALTTVPRMIRASSFVTDQEAQRYSRLSRQQRKIDYLSIPADRFSEDLDITEEELKSYFEKHASRFIRPEQTKLEYIQLNAKQLASRVEVTDDAIRKFYETNVDRYVVDEQREASHILISLPEGKSLEDSPEVADTIREIQTKLDAGGKFEDLAKEYSQDPGSAQNGGSLGQVLRGVMVPAFEEALFAMNAVGEVSSPVQSSFGMHLIRLDGVTPKQTKSFEDVQDQIRASYASEQAVNIFYDMSELLAVRAYENPDSLAPVAEAIDIPLQTTDWVDQNGTEFGITSHRDVLREAFSERLIKSQTNSDPVEIGINDVVVFRVVEHRAAQQLSFDEARDEVMIAAAQEKQTNHLKTYANQIVDRIRNGEPAQSISEKEKIELKSSVILERGSNHVPSVLVRFVYKMPLPENGVPVVRAAPLGNDKQAVVMLLEAINPDVSMEDTATVIQGLNRRLAAKDASNLLSKLRQDAKVTIHKDRL